MVVSHDLLFQRLKRSNLLRPWVVVVWDFNLNLLLTNISAVFVVVQLERGKSIFPLFFPRIFLKMNMGHCFDLHATPPILLMISPKSGASQPPNFPDLSLASQMPSESHIKAR